MPVNPIEQAVRDTAAALYDAIMAAEKIGLRVDFPRNAAGLLGIPVSETAKFIPPVKESGSVSPIRPRKKP
jgi:O-acetyl-ADP-ribose deacetylase (regulator of RNase III)